MLRSLAALASLALAGSPLDAQVGLASSARTVGLTATKHGSVSVALPGDFAPLAIEAAWDLDPTQTSAVSLVAFFQAPGGSVVLFSQPMTTGASAGTRTDQMQVRIDLSGRTELPPGQYQGTLNLLAITQ